MNLGGQCPNRHYMDANCKCPRPTPQSPSQSWEERERFYQEVCLNGLYAHDGMDYYDVEKEVKSFIKNLLTSRDTLMKQRCLEEIGKILTGIDKDEIEDENGWWETSTGAKFGKTKLLAIKKTVTRVFGDE